MNVRMTKNRLQDDSVRHYGSLFLSLLLLFTMGTFGCTTPTENLFTEQQEHDSSEVVFGTASPTFGKEAPIKESSPFNRVKTVSATDESPFPENHDDKKSHSESQRQQLFTQFGKKTEPLSSQAAPFPTEQQATKHSEQTAATTFPKTTVSKKRPTQQTRPTTKNPFEILKEIRQENSEKLANNPPKKSTFEPNPFATPPMNPTTTKNLLPIENAVTTKVNPFPKTEQRPQTKLLPENNQFSAADPHMIIDAESVKSPLKKIVTNKTTETAAIDFPNAAPFRPEPQPKIQPQPMPPHKQTRPPKKATVKKQHVKKQHVKKQYEMQIIPRKTEFASAEPQQPTAQPTHKIVPQIQPRKKQSIAMIPRSLTTKNRSANNKSPNNLPYRPSHSPLLQASHRHPQTVLAIAPPLPVELPTASTPPPVLPTASLGKRSVTGSTVTPIELTESAQPVNPASTTAAGFSLATISKIVFLLFAAIVALFMMTYRWRSHAK